MKQEIVSETESVKPRMNAVGMSDSVRSVTKHGREYLVFPMVAAQEMVLNYPEHGTKEYLPAERLQETVEAWAGIPLVYIHPQNQQQTARRPEAYVTNVIGQVHHPEIVDGDKLRVETWVDVEKANAIGSLASEVVEKLRKNQELAVSTGYRTVGDVQTNGTFDGEIYNVEQGTPIPDHIAIFPDDTFTARCSPEDGCAAPRVNAESDSVMDAIASMLEVGGVTANALSEARTPEYDGTTEADWDAPSFTEYVEEYYSQNDGDAPDDISVDEVSQDAIQWTVSRTLVGDPDADSADEIVSFPVVNLNGELNRNALESAKSLAHNHQAEDSIKNRANSLLEDEFDVDVKDNARIALDAGLNHTIKSHACDCGCMNKTKENASWTLELHPRDRKGSFRKRPLGSMLEESEALARPPTEWDGLDGSDIVIDSNRATVTEVPEDISSHDPDKRVLRFEYESGVEDTRFLPANETPETELDGEVVQKDADIERPTVTPDRSESFTEQVEDVETYEEMTKVLEEAGFTSYENADRGAFFAGPMSESDVDELHNIADLFGFDIRIIESNTGRQAVAVPPERARTNSMDERPSLVDRILNALDPRENKTNSEETESESEPGSDDEDPSDTDEETTDTGNSKDPGDGNTETRDNMPDHDIDTLVENSGFDRETLEEWDDDQLDALEDTVQVGEDPDGGDGESTETEQTSTETTETTETPSEPEVTTEDVEELKANYEALQESIEELKNEKQNAEKRDDAKVIANAIDGLTVDGALALPEEEFETLAEKHRSQKANYGAVPGSVDRTPEAPDSVPDDMPAGGRSAWEERTGKGGD